VPRLYGLRARRLTERTEARWLRERAPRRRRHPRRRAAHRRGDEPGAALRPRGRLGVPRQLVRLLARAAHRRRARRSVVPLRLLARSGLLCRAAEPGCAAADRAPIKGQDRALLAPSVRGEGSEPSTKGLKVPCSTAELAPRLVPE